MGAEVAEADILRPETLPPAVAGMDGVFQVAATYHIHAADPKRDIYDPAVTGSLNVLKAAHAAGVKKVVYTSSVAAVGLAQPGGPPATEDDWPEGQQNAYTSGKTDGERQAWAYAKESGLNMVVVNPGVIIGPGFHRHTDSTLFFSKLLKGKIPMAFLMLMPYVDARDVAEAHLQAYEREEATGRHIAVGHIVPLLEMCALVKKIDPSVKVPTKNAPNFMVPLFPLFDWLESKMSGTPRSITRDFLKDVLKGENRYDTGKIQRDLGWTPRPLEETARDTIDWIREKGL